MVKRKKRENPGMSIRFILIVLFGLTLLLTMLVKGNTVAVLAPKGLIASEQRQLMFRAVLLLLEIAIPALTLFYFTAWKYRESNNKAAYAPQTKARKSLVFSIWAFPFVTLLLLATLMIPAAHKLAPQKAIDPNTRPLTIQVIAMRWKWLFIYPGQKIAAVNFMQIPTGVPVQFDLTADETPMSSFWIPQLGGQLYAMTGHVNLLNLMATSPGDYAGRSAEINGAGFSGMQFTARASSLNEFNDWVQSVKQSPTVLSSAEYQKLLAPSQNNATAFYSQAGPEIYDTMLSKYIGSHGGHIGH